MFKNKMSCALRIAIVAVFAILPFFSCGARKASFQVQQARDADITALTLRADKMVIRKYVIDKVANDIKKAKKWGKGMAKAFAGISNYAFDAIPFEFFSDATSIDQTFNRLEEGILYIQNVKEAFKRTMPGNKKKINQSQLAEFLYNQLIDKITVTDAERVVLKREPIKIDEWVRNGTVKRSEYMYYTLLNFVVRYYLEQELKHR